ncbi:MAG TPA: ABC transporter substrate-binding protein [Candidatus Acidoferrum sp.]|nr:ABC transporter substrate-binding protein [Candidatus Acidoferrum sp.]
MLSRRRFLGTLGAGLVAEPLVVEAQQPSGKVRRVAFLYFGSRQPGAGAHRYAAFLEGMRELGYIEGKNVIVEARFAESKPERLPALVAELLRLKMEVIVAAGGPVYRVLQRTAAAPPVVVTVGNDPVLEGFANSLARPGGNFTGLNDTAGDLTLKQLELLKIVLPKLSRVGVLINETNASHGRQAMQLTLASQKLGRQVVLGEASAVEEIEPTFASLARERAEVVVLFGDTFFSEQLRQIAGSALRHHLPSIYMIRDYADAGGLMSYGAPLTDNFRRAATFVDKILKGAKPGELPFEQPTRYILAINLKTAKALGLTIPPALLLRADQVIE